MKKVFENDKLLPEIAGLVKEGYVVSIPVRGNSMLPFLRDGRDAVILGTFKPDTLSVGALVLARISDGRIVLHRLLQCRAGGGIYACRCLGNSRGRCPKGTDLSGGWPGVACLFVVLAAVGKSETICIGGV